MPAAAKDPSRTGSTGESGFSANITGASLADLVQLECLANSTLAVRVVSGAEVGYLYFQAGQIVHAMSSDAVGDGAALEILGWDRGSFEPCNAGWPTSPTVNRPWQALLMHAATIRDEARRRTVVDFPRERTQGTPMQKPPSPITPPPLPPKTSEAPQSGTTFDTQGIERAVRLEADGRLLASRGDAEELAAITAYTMRLALLIGERLGMEELRAVECVTAEHRRLFYAERNGNLIGIEAPNDADLSTLRERLGF
ncbi:MAG TPA: DUF4388 domain-containing protein [Polyangiaceae bacterium]|nr:DUF4388 domain-containing protein [Polyangiaceae bacterium]